MNFPKIFTLLLIMVSAVAIAQSTSTQRAGNVQVHEQYSNLISGCKNLGPLNFRYKPTALSTLAGKGRQETIDKARERAAEMNGDALVIVNMQDESLGAVWRLQAVVLSCFKENTSKHDRSNAEDQLKYEMACQADSDCDQGMSCRSRKGGGAECREIK